MVVVSLPSFLSRALVGSFVLGRSLLGEGGGFVSHTHTPSTRSRGDLSSSSSLEGFSSFLYIPGSRLHGVDRSILKSTRKRAGVGRIIYFRFFSSGVVSFCL